MESRFLICPFTGQEHFITGVAVCPSCGRTHESPYYIKGKDIKWYQKKNQWIESVWHNNPQNGRKKK